MGKHVRRPKADHTRPPTPTWPNVRAPRKAQFIAASALLTVLAWPSSARADAGDLFDIFGKEGKGLLGEGVHFDARMGLWWANLDGGLSSLTNAWDDLDGDTSPLTDAARSIGTGEGLVREVGLSMRLKDNYVGLDYLSNRLVELAQDEAEERIDNPLARTLIERFIGELRPDLKSLADLDADVWIRGEYGRFRGELDSPEAFLARNGEPWFPKKTEGWQTDYLSLEVGFGTVGGDAGSSRSPGAAGKFGFYGRYRNFSRPVIGGYGQTPGEMHFLDGGITTIEFGARAEITTCETFCWTVGGSFVPFTGYAYLDFGEVGWLGSMVLALGGNAEVSYPLSFWDYMYLSPYVGFKTEFLMPVAPTLGVTVLDPVGSVDQVTIWNPDYFFWGPTAGVNMSF